MEETRGSHGVRSSHPSIDAGLVKSIQAGPRPWEIHFHEGEVEGCGRRKGGGRGREGKEREREKWKKEGKEEGRVEAGRERGVEKGLPEKEE